MAVNIAEMTPARFNQTLVSYDSTKDDKVAALAAERSRIQERLREKEK